MAHGVTLSVLFEWEMPTDSCLQAWTTVRCSPRGGDQLKEVGPWGQALKFLALPHFLSAPSFLTDHLPQATATMTFPVEWTLCPQTVPKAPFLLGI